VTANDPIKNQYLLSIPANTLTVLSRMIILSFTIWTILLPTLWHLGHCSSGSSSVSPQCRHGNLGSSPSPPSLLLSSSLVASAANQKSMRKLALIRSNLNLILLYQDQILGKVIDGIPAKYTQCGSSSPRQMYARSKPSSCSMLDKMKTRGTNYQGCCCCLLILSSVTISVRMFTTPYNSSNPPARSEIAFAKLL
jgi:hypothetical protein